MESPGPPRRGLAVRLTVAFFVVSGGLELVMAFEDAARPSAGSLWEALGRALLHWLVAAGLWRGLTLCRWLALVYCLAAIVTYAAVLALALGGAPLRFPPSVVVGSLFQVPSCAVLLPWLRSPAAARAFPRPIVRR
jgi:hypothetical protein